MNTKKIIAIVGMAGSGKSTAIETLVQKYQLPYIYLGDITLQEMKKNNLEPSQANEKKMRTALREQHGMEAYAKLSLPKIKEHLQEKNLVLLDGLYSWSEYTFLRKELEIPTVLVAVIVPKKLRYERLQQRQIRPLSPQESEKRDFAEIEGIEKGGPIAICDYYLTNDSSLENLNNQITALMKEIE